MQEGEGGVHYENQREREVYLGKIQNRGFTYCPLQPH